VRRWCAAALVAATAAGGLALGLDPGAARAGGKSTEPTEGPLAVWEDAPVTGPTTFRLSSFNILGADHTGPGGNHKGYALGETRMKWAWQLVKRQQLSVVGFQELQQPQFDVFERKADSVYDWFPGDIDGTPGFLRNTIAWRADTWRLVSTSWLKLPYFHGDELRMPLVLLQHLGTGQQVYFMNFQNPADVRGNAEKWRLIGQRRQSNLVNKLRDMSGLPVFWLGDMNSRDQVFCRVTRLTAMVSASGGSRTPTSCSAPRPSQIDYIFGSAGTTFTGYLADRSEKVRRTSDHPMIVANATVPATAPKPAPTPTPTPTPTVTPTLNPSPPVSSSVSPPGSSGAR
jgi:hypothetical protein